MKACTTISGILNIISLIILNNVTKCVQNEVKLETQAQVMRTLQAPHICQPPGDGNSHGRQSSSGHLACIGERLLGPLISIHTIQKIQLSGARTVESFDTGMRRTW